MYEETCPLNMSPLVASFPNPTMFKRLLSNCWACAHTQHAHTMMRGIGGTGKCQGGQCGNIQLDKHPVSAIQGLHLGPDVSHTERRKEEQKRLKPSGAKGPGWNPSTSPGSAEATQWAVWWKMGHYPRQCSVQVSFPGRWQSPCDCGWKHGHIPRRPLCKYPSSEDKPTESMWCESPLPPSRRRHSRGLCTEALLAACVTDAHREMPLPIGGMSPLMFFLCDIFRLLCKIKYHFSMILHTHLKNTFPTSKIGVHCRIHENSSPKPEDFMFAVQRVRDQQCLKFNEVW